MQNSDTMGKSKDKTAQKEINNVWLKVGKHTLHDNNKADIENRKMLDDKIIDAAQFVMKKQFTDPKIEGFQSVLNKQRVTSFKKVENDMMQILHRGSPGLGHWLTVSNLNCQERSVNVFDSFYNDINKESKLQIANILKSTGKNIKFNIIHVQRQAEGTECGLFAIAFAVALGFGFNPTKLLFKQKVNAGSPHRLSNKTRIFQLSV